MIAANPVARSGKLPGPACRKTGPARTSIVEAYTLSNEEMSAMVGKADLEGVEVDTVVADWMAENKDRWSGWISQ